jgi:hypothetical protein
VKKKNRKKKNRKLYMYPTQAEVQLEPMRRLGYNPRQQRLLSLFPCSRLAFNGRRPADPDHWVLSKGDAVHWQARTGALLDLYLHPAL